MIKSLTGLQRKIQSDAWETALAASDELVSYGKVALPILVPLLASPFAQTRNVVALALRQIKHNAAVEPLVQALRNPATTGNRGTILYALQTHDCSNHLLLLFDIALTDTYEVRQHALMILQEQQFWYDLADLDTAQAQLEAYAHQSEHSAEMDSLIQYLQTFIADLREQAQK